MQLNLDEFIDILQLSISDDSEKVKEGLRIINLLKSDQLNDYLNLLIFTFTNDSTPDNIKHTSIVYFKNEITPTYSKPLKTIQELWFKQISEINRNTVKDFVLYLRTQEGLPFNFGCLLIATIYLIEQDTWNNLLPNLSSILESNCTHHDIYGIIRIYTEIFYLFPEKNLNKAVRNFQDNFIQLIQVILSILQDENFEPIIREESSFLLYKMIQAIPKSPIFKSQESISSILDIFPQTMPIANEKSFETMYDILFLFLEQYPDLIQPEKDRIISYCVLGFSCTTVDFLIIVINFLGKIPQLSYAKELIEGSEDSIFDQLKNFMIPNEELDPKFLVSSVASDCFGQFCILYREQMFSNFSPQIIPMLQDNDWHNVYAGLLGLRSLIHIKDLYLITNFFNENIQIIIDLFNSEDANIAKLAISVTCNILQNYPKIGEESDGLIGFAIEFLKNSSGQELEKFIYALSFLSTVIQNSNIIYINSNYPELFEITTSLVNSDDIEDRNLQNSVFDVFKVLVCRTKEPNFREQMLDQLNTFITTMNNLLHGTPSEQSFLRLQNICSTIKCIIDNIQISDELYTSLIENMFTTMDTFPQLIDTDIFSIFSSIFKVLKKKKEFAKFVEYIQPFIMFCRRSLASQIPELIGESAEAYSYLLLLFHSSLESDYKELINDIVNIIVNEANPSYTNVYSKMMYSIGNCIAALGSSFSNEHINQIMNEIYLFITKDFDSRNQNEIETFREILPSILYLIKSVYEYYNIQDNDFDSFMIFAKQNYIKIILQKIQTFKLYDSLILIGALQSLKAITNSLKNKINVQLRSPPVKNLLQVAQSSEEQKVKKIYDKVEILVSQA